MSASSKKKLRKEQNAATLTEKQRTQQAEAKKLKAYSIVFIVVMLVVAIIALTVITVKLVQKSGVLERNTIAVTVDGTKINAVELNYYYNDIINANYESWYDSFGDSMSSYLSMMGLDLYKPLNEQTHSEEYGTWANYFLSEALGMLESNYALYNKAVAEGFTLPEADQKTLDATYAGLKESAASFGYPDMKTYLRTVYGPGSSEESYCQYQKVSAIANAYFTAYANSLTYDDAALRAKEAEDYNAYSAYSFASYYLSYTDFLEGGTTDENGSTTYTDEERDAARAAAKEAAEALAKKADSVIALDKAIAAMDINKDKTNAASSKVENALYADLSELLRPWVSDDSRKDGDVTVIPRESTSEDEDGKEVTTVSGYYVVYFQSNTANLEPLANVRHLLVAFEGGTVDSETGVTTYTDEEKAAAKKAAEDLLAQWKSGEATEDSFIALVKEHSDDTSSEYGGLFEDIHPGSNYVENFLNWSIDPDRLAGDTGIVESPYGYHVMYYVADDEMNYRDYLIAADLREADVEAWYNKTLEETELTAVDLSRVDLDKVLAY